MWVQKSMLQPEPYVCKACGFSISHCINCVVLVSLPRCPRPSLKHLLSTSLVFDRADDFSLVLSAFCWLPPKHAPALGSSCFPLLHRCCSKIYVCIYSTYIHILYTYTNTEGNKWPGISFALNEDTRVLARNVGKGPLCISLCLCSEISFRDGSCFPVTLIPINPFFILVNWKICHYCLRKFKIYFERVKWT